MSALIALSVLTFLVSAGNAIITYDLKKQNEQYNVIVIHSEEESEETDV